MLKVSSVGPAASQYPSTATAGQSSGKVSNLFRNDLRLCAFSLSSGTDSMTRKSGFDVPAAIPPEKHLFPRHALDMIVSVSGLEFNHTKNRS
jgi:hypothetical protein